MLKQSPSPLKRLSILVNAYDIPLTSSPPSNQQTPSPFYQSPEPASPQSLLENDPVPRTARPKSLFFAAASRGPSPSPSSRTNRPRPKSYGGALTVEALELVLDFESRMAAMESKHSRVCAELEEARDALSSERASRRSTHRFSTLSHARFSSVSSSTTHGSDGADEVNDIEYERRLRNELQETLKKIRAQNDAVTRSLRQQEDANSSLMAALEEERAARKTVEEEFARLSTLNLTLFEHNKLLAGRDAALQEDISTLMTKAQAEKCMRAALEAELSRRSTTPSPAIETAELTSVREELQQATDRLSSAEDECAILRERVSTLQHQLVMCVDSSSQAIELERELRSDMEERARVLEEENITLRARLDIATPDEMTPGAWLKRSPSKRRPISGRLDRKLLTNLKLDTTDRILERYRHIAASKKVHQHRTRRLASKRTSVHGVPNTTLLLSPFPFPPPITVLLPPIRRDSHTFPSPEIESACSDSTKVASPTPSQRPSISISKRSPSRNSTLNSMRSSPMPVMLAATLSKKESRPQWSLFKANSSIYVDVNSSLDEPMPEVPLTKPATRPSPVKPKPTLRALILRRASTIFIDSISDFSRDDTLYD
ncbi:hypothetical protein MKEN_01201300 [Mycena kentingensis (nom. inval.)]|nr:hypothetical protein MKEN_01201300 [Mycena kentingensis (nom. inval.)]